MKQMTAVLKILRMLIAVMDDDSFDPSLLNHDLFDISKNKMECLLVELQDKGYIKGLHIVQCEGMQRPIVLLKESCPMITLDGLEYLCAAEQSAVFNCVKMW